MLTKATFLLALAALLSGPARAQTTPPATTVNPTSQQAKVIRQQTADRRDAAYRGPKVVKDGKKLGRKMLQDSKPVNGSVVAPVKQ